MGGNLIDSLYYVFCIQASFKAKFVRTLFIDRVLVEIKADINDLIELMCFIQIEKLTQVKGLADLYVTMLFLILQFVILVIYNYVRMINR